MTRKIGRYSKNEISKLIKLYDDGYSIHKICRTIKRSQNSIRNNLIRLGKVER